MYKNIYHIGTALKVNDSVEGETIEQKIERITTQNEPITDGAPLIYTERKEGVVAGYDIRTDRFDVAIEAMTAAQKSAIAKREERHKPKEDPKDRNLAETADNTSDSK